MLVRWLSQGVRPQNYRRMSKKQIFDNIASSREKGAATLYEIAVRDLRNIQFTNVEKFCDTFIQYFFNDKCIDESMISQTSKDSAISNPFAILLGYASFLLALGTEGFPWLDTWRQMKIFEILDHSVL